MKTSKKDVLSFFQRYSSVDDISKISSKEEGVLLKLSEVTETGISIKIDAHTCNYIERKLSPIVKAKNGDIMEDSNSLVIGLTYVTTYFEDRDLSVSLPLLMVDITDQKPTIFQNAKRYGSAIVEIKYTDIIIVNEEVKNFYFEKTKFLGETLESFLPHESKSESEVFESLYSHFKLLNSNSSDEVKITTGEESLAFKVFSSNLDFKGRSELENSKSEKSDLVSEYLGFVSDAGAANTLTDEIWYGSLTEHFPLGIGQSIVMQQNQRKDTAIIPVVGGPGTGKTTLFLSVVAQLITERAFNVIQGKDVSNLMLVTSTANKAVENVSNALKEQSKMGLVYVGGNSTNKMNSSAEVYELIRIISDAEFKSEAMKKTVESIKRIRTFIETRQKDFKLIKSSKVEVNSYQDLFNLNQKTRDENKGIFKKIINSMSSTEDKTLVYEELLKIEKKVFDRMIKQPSFGDYMRTDLFSLNYSLFIESQKLLKLQAIKEKEGVLKALTYLVTEDKYSYLSSTFGLKEDGLKEFLRLFSLAYPVVTSTLTSVGSMFPGVFPNKVKTFATILVDEAGMISSKDIMPALRRGDRAIIVGDPKQLSPIVTMEPAFMEMIKNEYADDFWEQYSPATVSAFHRAAGTLTGSKHEIGRGIILDEHRRCSPKIANLFIKIADYKGINVCTAKHDDQAFMNIGAEELMFFDIKNMDTGFSKSNLSELEVIKRLLVRLENAGYDLKKDIGIITPYKAQEALLVNQFASIVNHTTELAKIGTIHKFQGVEFKVVIFSSVISRESDSAGFVNQIDMINVAISRAKQCFMVVGDYDKLTHNPGPDNVVGTMATHIATHGKFVSMKGKKNE